MTRHAHIKHFFGAFGLLSKQPSLFLIAPIASIIGTGGIIDSAFYFFAFVVINSNASSTIALATKLKSVFQINNLNTQILSNWTTILITVIVLLFAALLQSAVIHLSYTHGGRTKKRGVRHAIKKTYNRLHANIGLQLSSLGLILCTIFCAHSVLSINFVGDSRILSGLVITFGLAVTMTTLTIKMIALQLAIGKKISSADATVDACRMIWRSPMAVLEHNCILFLTNIVAIICFILLAGPIGLLASALALSAAIAFNSTIAGEAIGLSTIVMCSLIVSGAITAFNLAAWSRLVRTIEKKDVFSAVKQILKTCLRI
jgi:hypothetical protein